MIGCDCGGAWPVSPNIFISFFFSSKMHGVTEQEIELDVSEEKGQ